MPTSAALKPNDPSTGCDVRTVATAQLWSEYPDLAGEVVSDAVQAAEKLAGPDAKSPAVLKLAREQLRIKRAE